MRERILAWLMRLYPRDFRESRSEEILGFIEEDPMSVLRAE